MLKSTITILGILAVSILFSGCISDDKKAVTTYKSVDLSVLNIADVSKTMSIILQDDKVSRYTMSAKVAFDTNVQELRGFNPLLYKCSDKPSVEKATKEMNFAYSLPYTQEDDGKDLVGFILFDDKELAKAGILVGDTIVEDMCILPYVTLMNRVEEDQSLKIKKSDLQKVYEDFLKVK